MVRRVVRRRGMSGLQAVLLLSAGFLVVWGLMDIWRESQGPLRETVASTLGGGPGAAPGGGPGRPIDPRVVGAAGPPPAEGAGQSRAAYEKQKKAGKDDWSLKKVWTPEWNDIPDATMDGVLDEIPGLNPKAVEAAKVSYTAFKYLKEAYKGLKTEDDRRIFVAMFEGLGSVAFDKGLKALGLSGPLAKITGGWTGGRVGQTIGHLLADGIQEGSSLLVQAFDKQFPGKRQEIIRWRRGLR